MCRQSSSCATCRFEQELDNPRALEVPEEDLETLIGDLDELCNTLKCTLCLTVTGNTVRYLAAWNSVVALSVRPVTRSL